MQTKRCRRGQGSCDCGETAPYLVSVQKIRRNSALLDAIVGLLLAVLLLVHGDGLLHCDLLEHKRRSVACQVRFKSTCEAPTKRSA